MVFALANFYDCFLASAVLFLFSPTTVFLVWFGLVPFLWVTTAGFVEGQLMLDKTTTM